MGGRQVAFLPYPLDYGEGSSSALTLYTRMGPCCVRTESSAQHGLTLFSLPGPALSSSQQDPVPKALLGR